MRLDPCLLITAVQQPGTSSPPFQLKPGAPPRVSSGCAGPPSPTAPVLCHGPILWSHPIGLGDDSPMHAPLQLISPSSPSRTSTEMD